MLVWTDKSGKDWKLSKMEDSHVLNTHRFLRRRLVQLQSEESVGYSVYSMLQGDMSTYCAEKALDHLSDTIANVMGWIREFDKEIKRRKLKALEEG